MFNAFETKFGYNKLLLLFVLLYISPLSQELPQKRPEIPDPESSSATTSDNLIGKRDFDLVFESFTCSTNDDDNNHDDDDAGRLNASSPPPLPVDQPKVLRKLSCLLNRNIRRRYLKMEMSFQRQINQFDFDIFITMQRGGPSERQPFVLLNLTSLNGCDFLAQKRQVTLMALARKSLDRYSNYPRHCPLVPNVAYYIQNFRWDLEQMPAFFLESPVHIEFTYIFQNNVKVKGVIGAKLVMKSNKKFIVDA